MIGDNVYHLPNNSKFNPKTKNRKGLWYFAMMVAIYPFAVTYVVFKQVMCNHEVMTVGTIHLQNGVKIKAKACQKCRKTYQGY